MQLYVTCGEKSESEISSESSYYIRQKSLPFTFLPLPFSDALRKAKNPSRQQ